MEQKLHCGKCKFPIQESFYFCPNCGNKLKEPPFSMSVIEILGLFAISALFPIVSMWPGIKLLMHPEAKAKVIGLAVILLNIIVIASSIWFVTTFIEGQLAQYQTLGL